MPFVALVPKNIINFALDLGTKHVGRTRQPPAHTAMTKTSSFIRHHSAILASALIVMAAGGIAAWRCLPSSADDMRRSTVAVEKLTWYELHHAGHAVLFFSTLSGDSAIGGLTTSAKEAQVSHLQGGCWMHRWPIIPSCRGRIVTADLSPSPSKALLGVRQMLERAAHEAGRASMISGEISDEIDYYLRVHGVQDEGYQPVAALVSKVSARKAQVQATSAVADSILHTGARLTIVRRTAWRIHYREAEGLKPCVIGCRLLASDAKHHLALIQTSDASTPAKAKAQWLLPWNTTNHTLLAAGLAGVGNDMGQTDADVLITQGRRKGSEHNFPQLLASDGCPLFTPRGLFAGLIVGHEIASRAQIERILTKGGWR